MFKFGFATLSDSCYLLPAFSVWINQTNCKFAVAVQWGMWIAWVKIGKKMNKRKGLRDVR